MFKSYYCYFLNVGLNVRWKNRVWNEISLVRGFQCFIRTLVLEGVLLFRKGSSRVLLPLRRKSSEMLIGRLRNS